MDWGKFRQSTNVEDRRGGGLGGGVAIGGGGVLLLTLLGALFGFDPSGIINAVNGGGGQVAQYEQTPANDEQARFVRGVLGDTEDVWGSLFQKSGQTYNAPRLVMFTNATNTGCGVGDASTGPFYCPADQTVYIDLSFFNELSQRFGAPGDFARAYVIAHEVGHHIQHELGIEQQVREQQQRLSRAGQNALSVRLELQADCFAGVWASSARSRGLIDVSDVREGLNAAAAIGDDRLSGGRARPHDYTHGSSEQRATWFSRGLQSGDPNVCNSFQ